MDTHILQLVATGLGSASLKPAFDYITGRTKAKADRISELETNLTTLMLKEQLRQEQEEKRLDERRRLDNELRVRDEAEREDRRHREEKRHQEYVRKEAIWREELAELRLQLGLQEHGMAQLRDEVADLRADKDQLTAELRITADHVVTLQEQLQELGHIPREAPIQPREPNGQFGEIHGQFSKKKGGKK